MIRPLPLRLSEYLDRLPTTDLYLLNPLQALRRAAPQASRLPPLKCLAPNVYALGRTGVIVRYGRQEDVERLRRAGVRRLVYIVDDDFLAGAEEAHLPARYREKLAAFARGPWPVLRDAADVVIVPGAVLAEIYGDKAQVVTPVWHRPPAATDHFSQPDVIEIVHLGTGSHSADIAALAPVIAEALRAFPQARLTLFSPNGEAPGPLKGSPQVRVLRPMSWRRYKGALPRMRFHLALYPLADTAFNRARSANKLYEHALVGAASLMSPNPALSEAARDLPQLFVEGGAEEWSERLMADLADSEAMRRRAEATRLNITANDPAEHAARAWGAILADDFA